MSPTKPLGPIEHVIVLMFENRSFDNIFGALHPYGPDFDGVPPGWSNPIDPNNPLSPQIPAFHASPGYDAVIMPFPDPNEDYTDMAEQIRGGTMKGFIANYAKALKKHQADPDKAADIMQYYPPGVQGNLTISMLLGGMYTVSDRYFGSGPVQTWPNRLFAHCATPGHTTKDGKPYAYLNNVEYPNYHDWDPFDGQLDYPTIFERLDANPPHPGRKAWKVYYDDEAPISAILKYVNDRWDHIFSGGNVWPLKADLPSIEEDFFNDVRNDRLPAYSFLEPRYQKYSAEGPIPPNSNHPGGSTTDGGLPPIDISYGETLLYNIYAVLRENPDVFKKTLLIVTYDEHGGLFDHVRPAPAVSPFKNPQDFSNFAYTIYGPRVPALFISPWIRPRPSYRPPSGKYFDHTSIISTLRAQFDLGGPLTPRDANAPVFEGLIDTEMEPNFGAELPEVKPLIAKEKYREPPEPETYTPPKEEGSIQDAIYRSYRARKEKKGAE